MKIELKKIIVENFMAYPHAEFDFFNRTVVSGRNGIGKSTIATAYTWLMFGCDYQLKDNPAVRRIVDSKPVDDMDVYVEAILDIDGKEVTARKVQKRKYKKDGVGYSDDNTYFINEVPKTLKAFNEYFEIDMNLLKMCSSPGAFLNQKTADMRSYLFGLVENVNDLDVAKENSELSAITDLLGKYLSDELSAMNKATKSKIDNELPIIDGQIMEKQRDIQLKSDIDVAELELLKNTLSEQLAGNIKKQTDAEALEKDIQKKSDGILELKFQLSGLQTQANDANLNKIREVQHKINDSNSFVDSIHEEIRKNGVAIDRIKSEINEKNSARELLAKKWVDVNNEKFDDNSTICPTCHRNLPDEEIKRLVSGFTESKKKRIYEIEAKGTALKEEIEKEKPVLAELESVAEENMKKLNSVLSKLDEYHKQLDAIPKVVDISDTEEYKKLSAEIDAKESEMQKSMKIDDMRGKLKMEENEIRRKLSECESQISKSDTSADEQRLEELRDCRIDMEQKKADAEKILYLLGELEKAKNQKLSAEINKHFETVQWQLFEVNKSGGYKSVCIPTVDGKSILSTMSNKGNQIIGKVDICNSIQKINDLSVPVFLDDSESLDVSNKERVSKSAECQLIMLEVTDNSRLSVMEG
nr:MAG TPA: chromosome partition protein [Caudoviricetes sp.]